MDLINTSILFCIIIYCAFNVYLFIYAHFSIWIYYRGFNDETIPILKILDGLHWHFSNLLVCSFILLHAYILFIRTYIWQSVVVKRYGNLLLFLFDEFSITNDLLRCFVQALGLLSKQEQDYYVLAVCRGMFSHTAKIYSFILLDTSLKEFYDENNLLVFMAGNCQCKIFQHLSFLFPQFPSEWRMIRQFRRGNSFVCFDELSFMDASLHIK